MEVILLSLCRRKPLLGQRFPLLLLPIFRYFRHLFPEKPGTFLTPFSHTTGVYSPRMDVPFQKEEGAVCATVVFLFPGVGPIGCIFSREGCSPPRSDGAQRHAWS